MKSSLILLSILFFFATVYAQFCSSDADCNSVGRCDKLRCSCFSGYAGNNCEFTKVSQCGWNVPDPLKTKFPPEMDPMASSFYADTLKVVIRAPFVQDRYNYSIWTIGHENDDNCTYPGPWWNKTLDNGISCGDRFTMVEPWAYAKTCGWNFTDTPNYEIYNVDFMVKNTEKVGVGKDGYPLIRTNQHALKMIVRFQKSIWLFATITSFSNINPLFAITKQIYDPITSTAILELTSQLPYPFKYTSPTIIQLPRGLTGVYTENSDPLDCPPAGICTQKWTLTLTIPEGICEFTGIYITNLTQICHPSYPSAECPVDPNNNQDQVIADITSENFCAAVELNIGLDGVMTSYADPTWTTPKDNFLHGQRACFKCDLTTNGQATLISVNITHVVVSYRANLMPHVITLRMDGSNTPDGWSLIMHPIGPSSCGFSFEIDNITTPVPIDGSNTFGIMAKVVVQYRDNVGVNTRSFEVMFQNGNTQETKLNTEFKVSKVNEAIAGASTNRVGVAVLLLAIFAYLFF